jgi:hypothetical protein
MVGIPPVLPSGAAAAAEARRSILAIDMVGLVSDPLL